MKFYNWINERTGFYGKGITFIDIDETVAHTKAKIHVVDKETGEVKRKLSNQEFNTYDPAPDETFDFVEFRDANLFHKTSEPIEGMVKRVRRMIQMLKQNQRGSWIVFLTARADFDDKKEFLQWFKDQGIDVNFPQLYIERAGNIAAAARKQGKKVSIAKAKEQVMLKYLKKYNFRRVRMIDDANSNLDQFLKFADKVPQDVVEKVRKEYNVTDPNEPVMEFFALHVGPTGKLSLYNKKEVY